MAGPAPQTSSTSSVRSFASLRQVRCKSGSSTIELHFTKLVLVSRSGSETLAKGNIKENEKVCIDIRNIQNMNNFKAAGSGSGSVYNAECER